MVIVRLMGGLGNQMFQYAAGRALSARYSAELLLDTSFFQYPGDGVTKRSYALGSFNIKARILPENQLPGNIRLRNIRRYGRIIRAIAQIVNAQAYRRNIVPVTCEMDFHSSADFNTIVPPCYLDGYWQSEKYFLALREQLNQEFSPYARFAPEKEQLLRTISHTDSVALHVRRGDYVTNPAINKYHGTCDLAYYHNAVRYIHERCPDAHFFVFSDDPAWSKEHLKISFPVTFVSDNDAHEDICLMSSCKHNVIANSSFSWWGAWLNQNPGKIVCAPAQWLRAENKLVEDIYPPAWVKL